jgi:hypothetical protein
LMYESGVFFMLTDKETRAFYCSDF